MPEPTDVLSTDSGTAARNSAEEVNGRSSSSSDQSEMDSWLLEFIDKQYFMRNLLKQKKQSSQPRSTGISNAGQKVPREGAKKTTSTKQPKGSARSYQPSTSPNHAPTTRNQAQGDISHPVARAKHLLLTKNLVKPQQTGAVITENLFPFEVTQAELTRLTTLSLIQPLTHKDTL